MARRVFFSFHYQADNWRASIVRNQWITKKDRVDAGFFDAADWEEAQKTSDHALKIFIGKQLSGTSVICVCVGAETANRRWVRYEIQRAFKEGRGLLAVRVHKLKNAKKETAYFGANPFKSLWVEVLDGGNKAQLYELNPTDAKWVKSVDFPNPFDLPWVLPKSALLSELFAIYDYVDDDGYHNLGAWIEDAATQAGR
jgi:hypothetical protein